MNKYAEISIKAIEKIQNRQITPVDAWKEAAKEVFPNNPASIEKSCPKSAFLGLCEDGYVKGVPPGKYTRSQDNKKYVIEALELLKLENSLSEKELWEKIDKKSKKVHNQQMNVVKILFEKDYLKKIIR